ncbi:DUF6361 family protein [Sedimentimonas flavescens]|uniref:DUF6361 family protein n=1 Tax=Sedimentimonas flavescens TaxID=2851012 RepID=UPI0021A82638|nr:DUF6361 family protein [Sedimentimonas flavescens]MCT2538762.1 DUF6361 family protein [Sedimentimonas flavescens]
MAGLAWIDFDQADRDRTRRIIDLFDEKDTRDELGLGAVRDALSDLLFPGTSTIQTRLRYMLFVPWVYRIAAQERSGRAPAERARALEINLIRALETGGESNGVIGSVAREGLKRLPSDVYWAGLFTLGIRRLPGGRSAYLEARDPTPLWAANLPAPQEGFLTQTSFRLRGEEADFLRDRLRLSVPGTLFDELAQAHDVAQTETIWSHPGREGFSAQNRAIVKQAERFSALMHGAALLYNLLLAERAQALHGATAGDGGARVDDYRHRLEAWRAGLDPQLLADWDLDVLWELSGCTIHRVSVLTRQFVEDWRNLVQQGATEGGGSSDARQLIATRERRLKGAKARLSNDAALARWGGASGTQPLTFRWREARMHLKDLADA